MLYYNGVKGTGHLAEGSKGRQSLPFYRILNYYTDLRIVRSMSSLFPVDPFISVILVQTISMFT